eukprot:8746597-Ditylum_brightwellii.AAC.1
MRGEDDLLATGAMLSGKGIEAEESVIIENGDGMLSTMQHFIVDTNDPCIMCEGSWKMSVKWEACFRFGDTL